MMNRRHKKQYFMRQKQQGSVLLIALVILLIMMIASIGLMHSVESGNVAAANISMGQNNQLVADWGVERGFEWLYTNRTNLDNNDASNGYYAIGTVGGVILSDSNWLDSAKWVGSKKYDSGTSPAPPAGYTVRVIINRMCSSVGAVNGSGQSCAKGATTMSTTSGSKVKVVGAAGSGSKAYYEVGATAASGSGTDGANYVVPGNVYYRVTVRVDGPRNSLSVVQSMLTIAPT